MLQLPVSDRWCHAPDQPFSDGWKEFGLRLFVRNTFIDVEDTNAEVSRSDASRRGSRSCVARICGDRISRTCSEDQSPTAAKRAAAFHLKDGAASVNTTGDRDDETVSLPSEDAEDRDTASSGSEPWAEEDREEWADAGSTEDFSQATWAFGQITPTGTPVHADEAMPLAAAMGFGCWAQGVDGWYSSIPDVGTTFPAMYEYAEYAALAPMPPQQLVPAPPMYSAPIFMQQEDSATPPPSAAPSEVLAAAVVPEVVALPQAMAREEASTPVPATTPPSSPPRSEGDEETSSRDEAPLPSEGSRLHGTVGEDMQPACQPCAWFYKNTGCKNGAACFYCHMCPKEELKTRKKDKVMRLRQQQQ